MTSIAFLLILLAGGPTQPGEGLAPDEGPRVETTHVEARPVPEALLAVQDAAAFREATPAREGMNPLQRLWEWLVDHVLGPLFDNVPVGLAELLLYGLLAAVLGFAIYHIFRGERSTAARRSVRGDLERALAEEGIEAVDLDEWLRRALSEGNHREAVRLYYLTALQALAACGMVDWAPQKTNSAYVRELGGGPLQEAFAAFSRMFDYVWYGSAAAGPGEVADAARYSGELRDAIEPTRP